MTDDLVQRLRQGTRYRHAPGTMLEAADRIEALEAALRYVDTAIYIDDCGDCRLFSDFNWSMIAAALAGERK